MTPYTPEERAFADEVAHFLRKEVDPRSRQIEQEDAIPDELMKLARGMGLFGITIPEQYGGSGLTLRGKCAIEALMRGERGTMEASAAKLYSTEALGKVVDAAVQIHGGMGYIREAGIETMYRDARIVRIYEGSSEIQRNIISGLLLK
jgi:alkylation response protein AidB-like acyl-CoA dehydrogenase